MLSLRPLAVGALFGLGLVAVAAPARALEVAGPPVEAAPPAAPLPVAVAAPEAREGERRPDYAVGVAAGVAAGLVLADIGFGAYDSLRVGQHRLPAHGPSIAEAAVA